MVGLPARGKTHTARRLARCFRWRLRPAAAAVSHADAVSVPVCDAARADFLRSDWGPRGPRLAERTVAQVPLVRARGADPDLQRRGLPPALARAVPGGRVLQVRTHARAHAQRGMIAHAHAVVNHLQPPRVWLDIAPALRHKSYRIVNHAVHTARTRPHDAQPCSCGVRRVAIVRHCSDTHADFKQQRMDLHRAAIAELISFMKACPCPCPCPCRAMPSRTWPAQRCGVV